MDITRNITGFKGMFSFKFTRIFTVSGANYFVSVVENTRITHYFTMKCSRKDWFIIFTPETPQWLKKYESALSNAINEG
jgi:hypothetical protein